MSSFPRFTYPQVIGAMSTATIASQVPIKAQDLSVYFFVSTFNAANPNTPYKFGSDQERMQYRNGQAYAIGGANLQNQ